MSYDPYQFHGHQPTQPMRAGQYRQTIAQSVWQEVPPEPTLRRSWWPYTALAAAIFFLGSSAWVAYDRGLIFKDSGIKACEAFRNGGKVDGAPIDSKADGTMTEAQYLQLRQIFKDSRHDDIARAGTVLMDVVWQISQLGKNPGLESLAYIGPMMSALTGMQGACANHGIVITIA